MHASDVTPEIAAHASELYWGSDHSVNHIAEELNLSKGALYTALTALGSGRACPLCGDEAGWPNRTARDQDKLHCASCAWSGSVSQTMAYGNDASFSGPRQDKDADLEAASVERAPDPFRLHATPRLVPRQGGADQHQKRWSIRPISYLSVRPTSQPSSE